MKRFDLQKMKTSITEREVGLKIHNAWFEKKRKEVGLKRMRATAKIRNSKKMNVSSNTIGNKTREGVN